MSLIEFRNLNISYSQAFEQFLTVLGSSSIAVAPWLLTLVHEVWSVLYLYLLRVWRKVWASNDNVITSEKTAMAVSISSQEKYT